MIWSRQGNDGARPGEYSRVISEFFAFLATVAAGTAGGLLGIRVIDGARALLNRAR